MKMIKITSSFIEMGKNSKGALNKAQLEILGMKHKIRKTGWENKIIGNELPESESELFLALKNAESFSEQSSLIKKMRVKIKPDFLDGIKAKIATDKRKKETMKEVKKTQLNAKENSIVKISKILSNGEYLTKYIQTKNGIETSTFWKIFIANLNQFNRGYKNLGYELIVKEDFAMVKAIS